MRVVRWFTDWRNALTAAVVVLVALLCWLYADNRRERNAALALLAERTAVAKEADAAHRVTVAALVAEMRALTTEVADLRARMTAAGIDPGPRPTPTTTTAPRRSGARVSGGTATTTTSQPAPPDPPTTTTTTSPATTTSTTTTTTPCAVPNPLNGCLAP